MKSPTDKKLIQLLACLAFIACFIFLFAFSTQALISWSLRWPRLLAFILVAISLGLATVLFQTLTHNRLLSPNVMGMDSLYIFFQLLTLFIKPLPKTNLAWTFILFFFNTLGVIGIQLALYYYFFKKHPKNLPLLLLFGLVFNILMRSVNEFLMVIIDPDEYAMTLSQTLLSFNYINKTMLLIASLILIPLSIYIYKQSKELDLIRLGWDYAINLGLDMKKRQWLYLSIIAILTSLSTALVGPVSFLGFIAVQLAYRLLKSIQHHYLFITTSLLLFIFIVFGQILIEHFFDSSMNLGVFIEIFGGLCFLSLLMKGQKKT